jgi:succinoglycan biosynthesis transport protein ExoP
MLQINTTRRFSAALEAGGEESLTGSLLRIQRFISEQFLVIFGATVACIAAGILYLLITPPNFTAVATLVIDTRKVQLFQQQSLFNDLPADAGTVETQVEILKSENIALKVIKDLHLEDDPEFVGSGGGGIGRFAAWIMGSSDEPLAERIKMREAVRAFLGKLSVRRVGLTYVIEVSFRSVNADRAAQIANAVADAYIVEQLEAKYVAARRAGGWLQDRLRELREQAGAAERAVVEYKNQNDIVDAGGRLMNEQQLAEVTSQLTVARTQTADARAKLDRIQSVLNGNTTGEAVVATVSDTLKNEVITKLRSKYLDIAAQESDWSKRYGSGHLAAINLRNQMREIENSIRNELQRIAETYKSEYEIAKQRQDSLQRQLDETVSTSQAKNEAQVKLRELESNSQSYRALYDNFMQRYMESVQQQSFPITEARVISPAARPLSKSHPKSIIILGIAVVAGLGMGIGIGAWRDLFNNVLRSPDQVESTLGVDCLALVPLVAAQARTAPKKRPLALVGNEPAKQFLVPPAYGLAAAVVDAPFSPEAEAVRAIKLAIDLQTTSERGKIIGITSSIAGEGKTSVSAALARIIAQSGARTMLVDADMRNPSLSRLLAPMAEVGLMDVLYGKAKSDGTLWQDPDTGLCFLPGVCNGYDVSRSSNVLASGALRAIFQKMRSTADYIIVDLPPVSPIVDVRAAADLIDNYVYVVEWGKTNTRTIEQALRSAKTLQERLVGVVLNKVDFRWIQKGDGYSDSYYRRQDGQQTYG